MISSGIILAFLSFFHNDGDISEGVLWYMAQALTYAGGIFGVSIYFKTKLCDFESRAREEIVRALEEAEEMGRKHPSPTPSPMENPEPLNMEDM